MERGDSMKRVLLVAALAAISISAFAFQYAPQPRVHVPNVPITKAVTATASQLVAANADRTGLECTNVGAGTAFLYQGGSAASAVANSGTAIPAGNMWWANDYNMTVGIISVVAASGVSTTLSCQEYQ